MALAVQAIENACYRPVLDTNPAHPNDWPVRLIVSSQTEARHNRALWAPTHLVSIRAPATRLLSMIDLPPERHLELRFGDTIDPDAPDAARPAAIEATFAFINSLPEEAHLLIHCLRGIGRSTALTLGVLARYMDRRRLRQRFTRCARRRSRTGTCSAFSTRLSGSRANLRNRRFVSRQRFGKIERRWATKTLCGAQSFDMMHAKEC